MNDNDWPRLSPLLDELFDLDPRQRAARLARIAVDDAALAAELRRLLAADDAPGLLDDDVGQAAATMMSRLVGEDGRPTRPGASRGKRVGHYCLVERIGVGGMGEVWRGERSDDFQQQVAIKLIRPLMDSPVLRERFARERRILARLDHPGIARLLDGGVTEDGTPWYAMEFVRGVDLVSHANAQAADARSRVELLLQVCAAVAHAQAQLIVHRDLKPSNVLVDAQGRVRVLDFGIARLLDDSADSRLTGTGMRLFSPAYAAPEQIMGEAAGTATDVYALGALLYELLTGRTPHPGRGTSPERLLAGLAQETAPRPSQALRERSHGAQTVQGAISARELTGDLDTIVAKALQPEPARRYAGAAQLADDLRRWLDGRPITAQPDTAGYRMRKFVARHRFAVGSASAVLLALLAGLGIALWQASVAREQAERTQQTFDFVMSLFTQATPTRSHNDMTVTALLREGLGQLDEELDSAHDLRAILRGKLGSALAELGDPDFALVHLQRAVAEFEELPAGEQRDASLASALSNLAIVYKVLARLDESEAAASRALALFDAIRGDHRLARIRARALLANLATTRQRFREAIALHERILVDRRALPDLRPADLAVDYNNLAAAYLTGDRYVEAEQRYRDLDRLLLSSEAPESRRVYALGGIAWALLGQGRHQEALDMITQTQALGTRTLGEEHQVVLAGDTLRARVAMAQGDVAAANALFVGVIERLPPLQRGTAELNWALGMLEHGRTAEAQTLLEAAIPRLSAARDIESPSVLLAHTALAALRAHDDPAVLPTAREAFVRFEASDQTDTDEQPRAALLLADALARLGQVEEALALRRQAVQALETLFGAEHPVTRKAQTALAASQGELHH